jgi:hypothetical protein
VVIDRNRVLKSDKKRTNALLSRFAQAERASFKRLAELWLLRPAFPA